MLSRIKRLWLRRTLMLVLLPVVFVGASFGAVLDMIRDDLIPGFRDCWNGE